MIQRITVVGAGAIGGWIAAKLSISGADVATIARGPTLHALRQEGLSLTEQDLRRVTAIQATDDPASLGSQDLVVMTVKAPALADACAAVRPLIGQQTIILPMLNGVPWWFTGEPLRSVDPDGRIQASLPMERVLGCVVHASCFRTAANAVTVKHADKLILGEPAGGSSDRVSRLAALFEDAGISCQPSESVRRAIWYKLWGNATVNPLSALTRATADQLLADPSIRQMMARAMDELAAVGVAIGCPISEAAEDRMKVTERLGAFKTSMLQDVEAGRPIELESLLGAPREIAVRAGVATPQLDQIYALTRRLAANLGLAG